jgi:hypothetical protein
VGITFHCCILTASQTRCLPKSSQTQQAIDAREQELQDTLNDHNAARSFS